MKNKKPNKNIIMENKMKKPLIVVAVVAALGTAGSVAYALNDSDKSEAHLSASSDKVIIDKSTPQKISGTLVVNANGEKKVITNESEKPSLINKLNKKSDVVQRPLMDIKEGVHYEVLKKQLTLPPHNGTMITEFFWLGCPHCQNFEPLVVDWTKRLKDEMQTTVFKIAVPGQGRWNLDAQVHQTMKKLGATSEQVTQMLSLYQAEGKQRRYPDEAKIKEFFGLVGLDAELGAKILADKKSFNADLRFSDSEFRKSGGSGVPSFVVDGKYKIKFDNIKTNDEIYEIMRALAAKK